MLRLEVLRDKGYSSVLSDSVWGFGLGHIRDQGSGLMVQGVSDVT